MNFNPREGDQDRDRDRDRFVISLRAPLECNGHEQNGTIEFNALRFHFGYKLVYYCMKTNLALKKKYQTSCIKKNPRGS